MSRENKPIYVNGRYINNRGYYVDENGRHINLGGQLIDADGKLVATDDVTDPAKKRFLEVVDNAERTPPVGGTLNLFIDGNGRAVDANGLYVDKNGSPIRPEELISGKQ